MDYVMKFEENEIVSIERENTPGILHRCLAMLTDDQGRVKFIIQDKYRSGLGVKHLKEYMYDNSITQVMLAGILGVSRTTIHRYLSGKRKIPAKYFEQLGIVLVGSELQTQAHMDKLIQVSVTATGLVEQLKQLIPGEE